MSFELDIKNFKGKVENRATNVVQTISLKLDRSVVNDTPVDTGQARGGWNVGINSVNLGETEPDKSGRDTIAANETKIQAVKYGDTVFLSNNVGHITFLEDGSSDQAPNGMVAKNLRRFHQFVREGVVEAKRRHP